LNEDGFYLDGIFDCEFAGDPDTRISVYGYVLYFCGTPIAWKSKAGKTVTLSSTESEYYATSTIVKEEIFEKNFLEENGIQFQFPITIKWDNVGAIHLANITVTVNVPNISTHANMLLANCLKTTS
jgi:hypothetical protein